MKLNCAQVQRTLGQFEASVIPNDAPVIAKLNELFGEHTFFPDDQHGLNIVGPVEVPSLHPSAPRSSILPAGATTASPASSRTSPQRRTSS